MIKQTWAALAATLCCIASPGQAGSPDEAQAAAERLLGSGGEDAQWQSYLPFTRKLHASGVVVESLASSTETAGVPPAAMLEALRALATALDLKGDVKTGDKFWIHYEREYTAEGNPVGTGRVLWAELRTAAKGTIGIHRFRVGKSAGEPFWLATGQSTETGSVRLPLSQISISSGFGLRADPFDQPAQRSLALGPLRPPTVRAGAKTQPASTSSRANANIGPVTRPPGLGMGPATVENEARAIATRALSPPPGLKAQSTQRFERINISLNGKADLPATWTPRVTENGDSAKSPLGTAKGTSSPGGVARAVAPRAALVMHQGVDFVAEPGTPVVAAADGVVTGAAPNGGYGNWIELEHEGKLQTVYGHLSAFAADIAPGMHVEQGQLIGFVGNTGRSTGPHLHFELLSNGKPTNPINHPAVKPPQLRGGDLERFRKIVARNLADAGRQERDWKAFALKLSHDLMLTPL